MAEKKEDRNPIPELYNLGPISTVLNEEYKALLDQVFAIESSRANIALSGPYGAGKSSVLLSYEKENPELRFLHISLGRFEPIDKDRQETQQNESTLERKIVNQLLHQINADNIPQSLFSVKPKLKKFKIFCFSLLLVIFVCSGYLTFNFREFISLLYDKSSIEIMKQNITQWIPIISATLFFGIGLRLVYMFVKQWKIHRPFSKMKFAGNEIEFPQDGDLPFFDKYLDEVLYLFKNAKVDAVVFEDIDRFDDVEIFERLREINNLLNETRDVKNDKPIRFIYLVKDDIFSTTDRVKFFDTIIPVIPVINSANSYAKFVEGLTRLTSDSSLDSAFLKGVSLHITDMRLVENICNEFMVYSRVINTLQLNQTKLFALIVYKNIFPRDFSLLQQNKGYVHTLFKSVPYYKEDLKINLQNSINATKEKIETIENEVAKSLEELEYLFTHKYQMNSHTTQGHAFRIEYDRRRGIIQDRTNLYKLQQRLLEAQTKLASIDNTRLATLIHDGNLPEDDIFHFKNKKIQIDQTQFTEITGSPMFDLLRYLLIAGYIDESYGNYLTFYYATEMSPDDMNFVLGVLDGKSVNSAYQILNPNQVIASIHVEFFSRKQILNYSLVHHLVENDDTRLSYIVNYLATNKEYSFIEAYLLQFPSDVRLFTSSICKYWESFFECLKYSNIFDEDLKSRIASYAVADCTATRICALNKDQQITSYVNTTGCILTADFEFDKANVVSNLDALGIMLNSIEINEKINQTMLTIIYETNAYKITFTNICQMYRWFLADNQDDLSKLNTKPLSLIFSNEESYLANYVHKNLNDFLNAWLLVADECTDDEKIVMRVLNSGELTNNREAYLNLLKTKITHVENITNASIRGFAIQNKKVEYSTHNLIALFKLDSNKTEKRVSELIMESDSTILVSEDDEQTDRTTVIRALITNIAIEDDKLSKIIRACHFQYETFSEPSLSQDRLSVLIQADAIRMDVNTYNFIHTRYTQPSHLEFINHNFNEYLEILRSNTGGYFQDDVLAILCSHEFTRKQQCKVLEITVRKNYLTTLPMNGDEYNDVVISKAIIQGIIDQTGFFALFSKKTTITNKIKSAILKWASNSWDDFIIKCAPAVDEKTCKALLHHQKIELPQKRQLFLLRLNDFSDSFTTGSLSVLGFDDIADCFDKSGGKVSNSPENIQILEELQKRNLLSFLKENNDDSISITISEHND